MVAYVTLDTLHFTLLVLLGAAGILLHWDVSRKLLREPELPPILRLLSPLPPLTPLIAVRGGRPFAAGMWILVASLYLLVRYAR